MTISYIIFTFSGAFSALVALLGLIFQKIDKNLKFIAYAVIFSFLEDLVSKYLTLKYHSNSWLYYFTTPIEYYLFSMFFYSNSSNLFSKRAIWFSNVLIFFYLLCNLIITQKPYPSTLYFALYMFVCLTVLPMIYYRDLLIHGNNLFIINIPVLTISSSVLIYSAFGAIYFALLIYLADTAAKYQSPIIIEKLKLLVQLMQLVNNVVYWGVAAGLLISMFKKKEMAK